MVRKKYLLHIRKAGEIVNNVGTVSGTKQPGSQPVWYSRGLMGAETIGDFPVKDWRWGAGSREQLKVSGQLWPKPFLANS